MLARGMAVAVVLSALIACVLFAQTPTMLLETLPASDSNQPINLNADDIATWKEGGKQILLLHGNAVITQGQSTVRAPECVVFVDLPTDPGNPTLKVTIYGESVMTLERNIAGQKPAAADYGYVRTVTTSKVNINPFKNKLFEEKQEGYGPYQRALARRPAELMLQGKADVDTGLRLTAAFQPAPVPPPSPPVPPGPAIDPSKIAPPVPKDVSFQLPLDPNAPLTPMQPNVAPVPNEVPSPPAPAGPGIQPNFVPPAPAPVNPSKPSPSISIRPRWAGGLQVEYKPVEEGRTAVIVNGGVAIIITIPPDGPGGKAKFIDLESDRLVIWTKGDPQKLVNDVRTEQGTDKGANELYLAGHVAMRTRSDKDVKTLRCNELYYDMARNVAVARDADFEIQVPKALYPIHVRTPELLQESSKMMSMKETQLYSGQLPSDPGLTVSITNMTIQERQYELSYLWGLWPVYDADGKRKIQTDHVFTGINYITYIEGVPAFYFPYFRGRVEDPLGPLDAVNAGYNRIFGVSLNTTWDLYDILDLPHYDGTKWQMYLDYLTLRGPGIGTRYEFSGNDLFSIRNKYNGEFKAYGIFDSGTDVLGGGRGTAIDWPNPNTSWPINPPNFRGWTYGKTNIQDLPDGFSFLGQFAFLSDRNFQEEYFLNSHLNDVNQDTYAYLKQQRGIWEWNLEASTNTQPWLTHTNWLPKLDGRVMGKSLFDDWVTFNTHASAGYAQL
ncbi:MAG TPA: hypothetical protein VFE62_24455, partial [Gemmataceae bacterium]|nr:hypothetical protein [Gemmataceae bacterium]